MSKAYNARHRALHGAYRLWEFAGKGCGYCGILASTHDHVPPLVVVSDLGLSHFEDAGIALVLIPACLECNVILGDRGGNTFDERKAYVKVRLRKRYAKYLRMPKWDDEEFDGMGYNLRVLVESGASVSEWVKRRLEY